MIPHRMTEPEPQDPCRDLFCVRLFGRETLQYWSDLLLWEYILNDRPDVKALIELGTWEGGMSLYLLAQCIERGLPFLTIDHTPPAGLHTSPLAIQLQLAEHFWQQDLLEAGVDQVRQTIAGSPHPLILLCDNGNKPRELELYVPGLAPGDLIAVHDWGTETNPPDLAPVQTLVEPIYEEWQARVGSATMWLRRK